MVGKSQNLSIVQKKEVIQILRKRILTWTLIALALLTGFTGYSLRGIKNRIEKKAETLVAKQFEEPKIQKIVQKVAAEQAAVLMSKQITPEVTKFKADAASQFKELRSIVAKTRELEAENRKRGQEMQAALEELQRSLKQSQIVQNQLSTFKSDIVEMQKNIAIIQYYQIKGANQFPNPYAKEMMGALNKLVTIAIPNPVERSKFITELQGPQEQKK